MLTTFACFAVLLLPQRTPDQDLLPDTPQNHWVYETVSELKSLGLLMGYPDGLGYSRPDGWRSRYQIAVAFHAVAFNVANLQRAMDDLARRPKGDREAMAEREEFLHGWRSSPWLSKAAQAILRLPTEFALEYKELGVPHVERTFSDCSATLMKIATGKGIPEVGADTVQFRDVPEGHWAAKAVLELRQAGILDGYPDGSFRG